MHFTKSFFQALQPEAVKMAVCNEYNNSKKSTDKDLVLSTFSRWVRTHSDDLTKLAVLNAIKKVTKLTDKQIFESKQKLTA